MASKHVLRFNATNKNSRLSFDFLMSGEKKIETRAATVRYKDIKKGDVLVFVCGGRKFEKKIKNIKLFGGIGQMLKVYKVKDIMPNLNSLADLEKAYYSFPGYKEKIKKFGLIAVVVK